MSLTAVHITTICCFISRIFLWLPRKFTTLNFAVSKFRERPFQTSFENLMIFHFHYFCAIYVLCVTASCLVLTFRLIGFLCFVALCTCHVHLHTLYVFRWQIIYLVVVWVSVYALFWNCSSLQIVFGFWDSSHSSFKLVQSTLLGWFGMVWRRKTTTTTTTLFTLVQA